MRSIFLCSLWLGISLLGGGCTKNYYPSAPSGFLQSTEVTSHPFQILHASEAKLSLSSSESLGLVPLLDTIMLPKNGHIILVHHSGLFIEFENDTTIAVADLAIRIVNKLNTTSNEIRYRPDIGFLLKTERKNQDNDTILRDSWGSGIQFLFPIENGTVQVSSQDPSVCLSWVDGKSNYASTYMVKIVNIFDETIDEIFVSGQQLLLNLSGYQSKEDLYIVSIQNVENEEFSPQIGISVGDQLFREPNTCEPAGAIQALEMAFYLESRGNFDESLDFLSWLLNYHLNRFTKNFRAY